MESTYFMIKKNLLGKGIVIDFTDNLGHLFTYDHDEVYALNKEKIESMPCWHKKREYTSSYSVPKWVTENLEMVNHNTKIKEIKNFTLTKSNFGKGIVMQYTDKKGTTYRYDHDAIIREAREKLEGMPCWNNSDHYSYTGGHPQWVGELRNCPTSRMD